MTKETEKAFKIIYCEYKRRRKVGFTKNDSIKFTDKELCSLPAFSDWLHPDVSSAMVELKSLHFVKANILGDYFLENVAIEYMENKPREYFQNLSSLFDILSLFG